MTTQFGKLNFDRRIKAAPPRVFAALTDPQDRMAWGPPDTGSVVLIEGQADPTPGAREMSRVGPRDNPYVDVATDWIVMDAPNRLIYVETLHAEGAVLASAFATFDLIADRSGTHLHATIHIANFAGDDMLGEVEAGWTHSIDALAAHASAR